MDKLKLYILKQISDKKIDVQTGKELLKELDERINDNEPVAIIGMALNCPQANDLDDFQVNLMNKINSVREFPEKRREFANPWLPDQFCETEEPYQYQGYLDDVSLFDESFFGISTSEAKKMHPIQRLFMMCAYEALEDAGCFPSTGMRTAIYVGNAQLGEARYKDFLKTMDGTDFIGSVNSMTPARIAYFLGLDGPGMVVDSACASGLLGVHMACEALRHKEIDCAIVCGAAINLMPLITERITFMESPESIVSPFDEKADGTVWGEGIGVVVLKRTSSALVAHDRIYAQIIGNGSNNNGASSSLTALDVDAECNLMERVWQKFSISPDDIIYFEAHGPGTEIGDAIEIKSISKAMSKYTSRRQFCGLGTIKCNTGHMIGASGIISLIKAAQALNKGVIPPIARFSCPNRHINLINTALYISDECIYLDKDAQNSLIAINNFGINGTNVHIVLGKSNQNIRQTVSSINEYPLMISAKTIDALEALLQNMVDLLRNSSERLDDICYTAFVGRQHHKYRIAAVAKDNTHMADRLEQLLYSIKNQTPVPEKCYVYYMPEISQTDSTDTVCYQYVNGSIPDVTGLFEASQKVSLPHYPFAMKSRWIDKPKSALNHPVIGRVEFSSESEDIYKITLDPRSWRINNGDGILSTSLVEIIYQIAELYYPDEAVELKEIIIHEYFSTDTCETLNVGVAKSEKGLGISIHYAKTCQKRISPIAVATVVPANFSENVDYNNKLFTSSTIPITSMRCIGSIASDGSTKEIKLEIKQDCLADLKIHHLHPEILHTVSKACTNDEYWCFKSCRKLIVFKPIPAKVTVRTECISETIYNKILNINIFYNDEPIALLEECVLIHNKRTKDNSLLEKIDSTGLSGRIDGDYSIFEKALGYVWREELGCKTVSIDESLIALGGDSLMAITVSNRLEHLFGYSLNPTNMLHADTIRQLAKLISEQKTTQRIIIKKAPEQRYYPVSAEQKNIYASYILNPTEVKYNFTVVLELNGVINCEKIAGTIKRLIHDNNSFRTRYEIIDGEIVQSITEDVCDTKYIEYSKRLDKDELDTLILEFIRPFNLESGNLLRSKLIIDGPKHGYLFLGTHHIAADGKSMALFMERFVKYFTSSMTIRTEFEYTDYAFYMSALPEKEKEFRRKYWQNVFSDELQVLDLPTDYEFPQSNNGGAVKSFTLDNETTEQIKKYCTIVGITPSTFLLAAFYLTLRKFSGQNDVVIGVPFAGRQLGGVDDIIGMFVETLPIRINVNGSSTLDQLVSEIQQCCISGIENADADIERYVREADGVTNLPQGKPVYNVMFTFQNFSKGVDITDVVSPHISFEVDGLKVNSVEFDRGISHCDLMMETVVHNDEFICYLEYNTDRFFDETAKRIADFINRMISRMLNSYREKISEISVVSDEEERVLLHNFCGEKVLLSEENGVIPSFMRMVERRPKKTAIIDRYHSISYSELNNMTNNIAQQLLDSGMGPDETALLRINRSSELIATILAIWKLGASYIPVATDYPLERILDVLTISQAKYIIIAQDDEDLLTATIKEKIIILNTEYELKQPIKEIEYRGDRIAYTIFTSGSTGKPKGASIEHAGMTNHISAKIRELGLNTDTIMAATASSCFDISIWQFFSALMVGGKVVIFDDSEKSNIEYFINRMIEMQISILEVVPAYLLVMLDSMNDAAVKLPALQYLLVTGDVISVGLVNRWIELFPDIPVVNAYGPTEASDDITHYFISEKIELNSVPVGHTIQNLAIYIIDDDNQLCPIGVRGEIAVSGIGVGRGYINNPEQTEKAFGVDLFCPERGRMYRTGDIGRWMKDGTLRFYGRKDHQIKLHGFRIELNEITSVVERCDGVSEAVTVLNGHGKDKYICCYYSSECGEINNRINERLKSCLPSYMIPSALVYINEMPHNSNGKINRKELPVPVRTMDLSEVRLATSDAEIAVSEAIKQIFSFVQINMNDKFIHIGGDSIKAIQLASALRRLGYSIEIKQIFSSDSLSDIALHLKPIIEIDNNEREGEFALNPMQSKYVYAYNLTESFWNQNIALVFEEQIDEVVAERALLYVVNAYSSLRLSFDGPKQRYSSEAKAHCTLFRSSLDASVAVTVLNNKVSIATGINIGCVILKHGTSDRLIFSANHLVIDTVSFRQVIDDFYRVYLAFFHGEEAQPILETSSYKTYVNRCLQLFDDKMPCDHYAYYRKYLTLYPLHSLFNKKGLCSKVIDKKIVIDSELTKRMNGEANKAYGTNIEQILLCALVLSVKSVFGGNHICIFCEHDMRMTGLPLLNLNQSVGWYAAEFPVICDASGADIEQTLISVKDNLLLVPWNGISYIYARERLHKENIIAPEDILFNYIGSFDMVENGSSNYKIDEQYSGIIENSNTHLPFPMEVNAGLKDNCLVVHLSFDDGVIGQSKAEQISLTLQEMISNVVDYCLDKNTVTKTPGDYGNRYLSINDLKKIKQFVANIND